MRVLLKMTRISAKLAEPGGFVFFHFDGDTRWAEKDRCQTRAQFEAQIVRKLPEFIRLRLGRVRPKRSMEEIDSVVREAERRLFPIVPHYSIEAWCYQNTEQGREASDRHHGGLHRALFDTWAANRGILDEIEKPKEVCCLGSGQNSTLARVRYPTRGVVAAGKSFAQAVAECDREALRATLAMTFAWPKPPSLC